MLHIFFFLEKTEQRFCRILLFNSMKKKPGTNAKIGGNQQREFNAVYPGFTISVGDLSSTVPPHEATTGMWVTEECKNSFMEMKWKKVHRYIVFKIDEGSRLVTVDKVGGAGEGYNDLAASLPFDDCRYAVFDFDFVTDDNCRKSKIFFIAWSPTASRIRAKILYATSKAGLRRVLDGISYEVQATDPTEMGMDVITDRAK